MLERTLFWSGFRRGVALGNAAGAVVMVGVLVWVQSWWFLAAIAWFAASVYVLGRGEVGGDDG